MRFLDSRAGEHAVFAVTAISALALLLRVLAANGELWLDEIWSLTLISGLQRWSDVFWRISHDNNHFLNSLWLWIAGADAAVLTRRALSIALAAASVPAAAWAVARHGIAASLCAALLAALALPLVEHGSEARGYAGLALCAFLATGAFLRAMKTSERHWAWIMAAAAGTGALFHLTAIALLAVLGLAFLIDSFSRGMALRQTIDRGIGLFLPSALAFLPALAALTAGVQSQGRFSVGGISPFSLESFTQGFGGMLMQMGGLQGFSGPEAALPGWAGLLALAIIAIVAVALWWSGRLPPLSAGLALSALVILPAIMAAMRMPNLEFPRYFLVPACVLIVLAAMGFAGLWRNAGAGRVAAVALLALWGGGQAIAVARFISEGRGERLPHVTRIAASGDARYTTNSPFRVPMIAGFLASEAKLSIQHVEPAAFCANPPLWFIAEIRETAAPAFITGGPQACATRYTIAPGPDRTRNSGWTLYRRL